MNAFGKEYHLRMLADSVSVCKFKVKCSDCNFKGKCLMEM